MMKSIIQTTILCLLFVHVNWAKETQNKQSGLLVVVHGSPSPTWNAPMKQLEKDILTSIEHGPCPFKTARVVNLEFKEPLVADGIAELMEQGCTRIVCMPLFIAHSSHVVYDVPAALGLYSSKEIHETLMEEGARIASSKVPIVMGPTISESDLLLESALERVIELSKEPQNEAVVLFAHGDHGIKGTWNNLARRAAAYVCGKTGITYADWAFVEVGQSYATRGISAIAQAAHYKKRILVIGLYISMGPERMHLRYLDKYSDPFDDEEFEVVFAKRGFLPDPNIADWLVKTASEIHQNRFGVEESE